MLCRIVLSQLAILIALGCGPQDVCYDQVFELRDAESGTILTNARISASQLRCEDSNSNEAADLHNLDVSGPDESGRIRFLVCGTEYVRNFAYVEFYSNYCEVRLSVASDQLESPGAVTLRYYVPSPTVSASSTPTLESIDSKSIGVTRVAY